MELTLWVESVGNHDMDLFVMANKSSVSGIPLPVEVSGAPYCVNGAAEYEWGNGHQRVSMRDSDDKSHFLESGEIVPVKIELCPMGMIFEKGQVLTIAISGYDAQTPELPGQPPTKTINKGIHVIHTGGKYQSTLTIPVVSYAKRQSGLS
jgi:predicted acyl esterase